jgi:hypothetical protein
MPAERRSLVLTERFHRNIDDLALQTADQLARRFNPSPDDELKAYFEEFIGLAATTVAGAQSAAATIAGGFFRGLGSIELGEGVLAEEMPDNAGATADGRSLEEALGATRAKTLLGLSRGWQPDQARLFARASFGRLARTEVVDAAGLELTHQMQNVDEVQGWRWRSRGTCGGCLALDDGSIRDPSAGMDRHPNCRCLPEPVFDVEERVARPTGHERFAEMTEKQQNELLGAEKARLLRMGLIDWPHLVHREHHREWNDSLTERSLQDVLAIAGLETET